MKRFLREWVFNNWSLKLLAVALSFLLWATYMSEPVVEVGYQVPLELVSIPKDLEVASDVPPQIYVRLRGRSALLRRITPADVDVRADLSSAKAGAMNLDLNNDAVRTPYGAHVVRIMPAEIHLVLTPRHTVPASP
jgi:YbbR domain-containing protein